MWADIPVTEIYKDFFIRVAMMPDDFWGYHITHWVSNFEATVIGFTNREDALQEAREEIETLLNGIQ